MGMGFEEDLQRLFARIIEQNGGNNAKAAESLQINKITFWGWTVGNRKRNETFSTIASIAKLVSLNLSAACIFVSLIVRFPRYLSKSRVIIFILYA